MVTKKTPLAQGVIKVSKAQIFISAYIYKF